MQLYINTTIRQKRERDREGEGSMDDPSAVLENHGESSAHVVGTQLTGKEAFGYDGDKFRTEDFAVENCGSVDYSRRRLSSWLLRGLISLVFPFDITLASWRANFPPRLLPLIALVHSGRHPLCAGKTDRTTLFTLRRDDLPN